ncbi:uncharacterized protein LOC134829996 isoform X2 [Culicoides brevitarsis]|uniref:uncharacterized protein LOC134829996 isoform X2 n=1 Tax=Culicoides brevitarsis TaxID=469753 RepID=UPI00307CA1A0
MLRLKTNLTRNSIPTLFCLLIVLIDVILASHVTDKYKLSPELQKCSKLLNGKDIFVVPFTPTDDPLIIKVSENVQDKIIAHIFALACNLMGHQNIKLDIIPPSSNDKSALEHMEFEEVFNKEQKRTYRLFVGLSLKYPSDYQRQYYGIYNLGPLTKMGRYVLYFVSQNNPPDREFQWDVLQSNNHEMNENLTKILKINQINNNTENCEKNCSIIIAQHINETKFIIKYIKFYQIRAKVFWLGANFKRILKELLTDPNNEFFVLHWDPSDITKVVLDSVGTPVRMPPCNNWTKSPSKVNLDCVFTEISMNKFVPKTVAQNHDLMFYLQNKFKFTETEYLDLITAFEAQNKSIHEFACDWMTDHVDFHPSPTESVNFKIKFELMTRDGHKNDSIVVAAELAKNDTEKFLQKCYLEPLSSVSFTNDDTIMLARRFVDDKYPIIVGPTRTSEIQNLAVFTKLYKIPFVTYTPDIGLDPNRYPQHFQTGADNRIYVKIILELMRQFKWHQMAVITEVGEPHTKYLAEMKRQFSRHGYSLLENSFKSANDTDIGAILANIQENDYKIIFIDVEPEYFMKIIKLVKNDTKYLEFFDKSCVFITTINLLELRDISDHKAKLLQGTLSILPATFDTTPNKFLTLHPNKTATDWRRDFIKRPESNNSVFQAYSVYSGYVYDAVIAIGLALQEIEKNYRHALAPIRKMEDLTSVLIEVLRTKVNFYGQTGLNNMRKKDINFEISQFWDRKYEKSVIFDHVTGKISGNVGNFRWQGGFVPQDQTYCAFGVPCKHMSTVIFIIVACCVVILLPLIFFLYFKQNYKRKIEEAKENFRQKVKEFDLASYEISPSDVEIVERIGKGHYAEVYLGRCRFENETQKVAVKKLKNETNRFFREFFYEMYILKNINHENIVKFFGFYFEERLHIVLEYLKLDNLKAYLKKYKYLLFDDYIHCETSPSRLTSFAKDVASALCYLETCNVVHRDLAARNVLLSPAHDRIIAKISDFGLAVNISNQTNYIPRDPNLYPSLPMRIMSPESVQSRIYTAKSDIWSFGVLLFEITTFGALPYAEVPDTELERYITDAKPLNLPPNISDDLRALIEKCLQRDPERRPSAADIVDELTRSPKILSASVDENDATARDSSSDPYRSDTGYGTASTSGSQRRPRTITYSSVATSECGSDTLIPTTVVSAGSYIPYNSIISGNYHIAPMITSNPEYYLQMNPITSRTETSSDLNINEEIL